ncbi:MAG TPA: hypothetical protein VH280_22765 [Verrucomicrobiae bacterium]|nr:hypothetical protein [Verrucomicrobiae bacterium]
MSASDAGDSRLAEALAECERLREENRQLRERMGIPQKEAAPSLATEPSLPITVTGKSSPDEKVNLSRSLFRGREDVYALRWEGRNGKAGYSPARWKVWGNPLSKRPDVPKEYFVDDVVANYGHVIVDECHHLSAVSFEQVLRQVKAGGRALSVPCKLPSTIS